MSTYVILIILFIIAIVLKLPKVKGIIGEGATKVVLKKLNSTEYFIINDLLIPSSNGKSSQIDHVVVSQYGVFVIETKNYKGWITGSENSQYWKQTIYKRKENLYNPIWQNRGHVKALEELLSEFGEIPFIPIVAFSGRSTLKVQVNSEVVYLSNLVKTIKKYNSIVINSANVQAIVRKLMESNNIDKHARKEHVHLIKQEIRNQNEKIKNSTCPSCGGQLVQRNGKYGNFMGCSNYPRCKYILKNTTRS